MHRIRSLQPHRNVKLVRGASVGGTNRPERGIRSVWLIFVFHSALEATSLRKVMHEFLESAFWKREWNMLFGSKHVVRVAWRNLLPSNVAVLLDGA